jgi:hypothetical protein
MAFQFLGVYFQDINGNEYRCGFHNNSHYMPLLERRDNDNWVEVNFKKGTGKAGENCRDIRNDLPVTIPFPNSHTQNERMELINQIIYNMNRFTTERVNYRGAHG